MNGAHYRKELDTPCLVVDLDRLEQNIAEMAEYARSRGLALRPHFKTHKTIEIAQLQRQYGAIGFTCAKLGEVEALVEAGVLDDILVAYQIVGEQKIARLLRLLERARITVAVDSVAVAEPSAAQSLHEENGSMSSSRLTPVFGVLVSSLVSRCYGWRMSSCRCPVSISVD